MPGLTLTHRHSAHLCCDLVALDQLVLGVILLDLGSVALQHISKFLR